MIVRNDERTKTNRFATKKADTLRKDERTKRRKNENEKTKTNRFATKKADALRKTKSKMKIRLTNHSPAHQYRSRLSN